ncbi:MAG: diguanylate cyclase domain-containing protein [Acidobacteriota bacterium]
MTQTQAGETRLLAQGLAILLAGMQLACLGLFSVMGPAPLVWVNGAAVLVCVVAWLLSGRGHLALGWGLLVLTMVTQAEVSLVALGWASGFQYFVLLGVPMLVGGPIRALWLKSGLALAVMASYVALDMGLRQRAGAAMTDGGLDDALYYFNVTMALLILMMLAGFVAQQLWAARGAALRAAQTDALTQVRNRLAFWEVAARENAKAKHGPVKLSVVLCNIDHLQVVNDTHGQQAGDAVLRAVGGVMVKGVRDADTMLRWTGDEFLAILPGTDEAGAEVVAERLRRGVEALAVSTGRQTLTVGMTVGVATLLPGDRLEDAIARATAAVTEGKQAGRRCVIYAYSPRPVEA